METNLLAILLFYMETLPTHIWTGNAHINMHMHVTYVWKKYAHVCGSLARIVRGGCYILNMFKFFSNNYIIDNQRTKSTYGK